ncbi:MAG: type II secretion system protein [Usitatibacter sp.]
MGIGTNKRAAGFTLIEIAVVIAVVGLLTAGVLAMLTALLKSTRSRVAADNAAVIQQSLQRFVERYNRLPCPARPTLAPGAAGYGVEDPVATSCPNTLVPATPIARGVVPWITLGLPLEQVQDGYGRMFTYHVTIAATQTTAANVAAMRGEMTTHSSAPVALGTPPTGNQINSCMNQAAPPVGGDDLNGCNLRAVVLLLSAGENGAGGYTSAGGRTPLSADPGEVENTDDDVNFVKGDQTATGYDDIVFAWSPDELLDLLVRQGSMKSAAAVTSDVLRNSALQISNAIVNAANCATLPCTAPIPPSDVALLAAPYSVTLPVDGWGVNPLFYTPGGANVCAMAPGLPAFRLTSSGLDRVLGFPPPTVNPATGRYDDMLVNVTADQMRSQLITRYGAGAC